MWANVKGQLSWIKHSLSSESEFSFIKNLGKQVELEILKSPPEEGMPEVQIREVKLEYLFILANWWEKETYIFIIA